MEDKNMANRIELKEQDLEKIVGGSYNFYYEDDGQMWCKVDGVGKYQCSADAMARLTKLKLEHKGEGLKAYDYVQMLIQEGKFW